MSFFHELKRRNVIRVGGLYIVTGWLLIQVAETLLPAFGAPDWVLRVLVIILAIGFAPALIFSWVFELTPEGLKRDAADGQHAESRAVGQRRLDIATMMVAGLAIVLLLGDRLWPQTEFPEPPTQQEHAAGDVLAEGRTGLGAEAGGAAEPVIDASSIAVLPFVNMSADKDNEYFSDGISEELLNVLVKVDGLSVASRTSSFAFKGRNQSAASIGADLKVAHVLEGSVRKSGTRVRITAQLIDTDSDRHLWSETYDRELTDIFAIQDEIAKAIVGALQETLGDLISAPAVAVQADTDNLQAYDLYLKARELFIARSELSESVRLFEQVVAMDPEFARGWEGLAAVTSIVESWGIDDRDYKAMVVPAAERALQLDPSLSMAWAALSMAEQNLPRPDWKKALDLADRAIMAEGKNATAYLWRSIGLMNLGFFDRALVDTDHCLRIDPAYRNCTRWKAQALLYAGDIEQAMVLFEQGVASGFITNRGADFVPVMVRRGDVLTARLMLDKLQVSVPLSGLLIAALSNPGTPQTSAEAIIEAPEAGTAAVAGTGTSVGKAVVYKWLGDFDRAGELDAGGNDSILAWSYDPPSWRNSAGFKRVLQRNGVLAYWQAHGFPPQCRPLGEGDFECDAPKLSR